MAVTHKLLIKTGSVSDFVEDHKLRKHVRKTVQRQLKSGVPVARYDATQRCAYLEYPDGRIEYQY